MLSTAVSILGKVLNTFSVRTPGSKGVYLLGSKVSVCAIPPAIQRTITASAVAGGAAAWTISGSRPISAVSVAPAVAPINPRRLTRALIHFSSEFIVTSINQLKLGLHQRSPQQIGQSFGRRMAGMSRVLQRLLRSAAFGGRRSAAQCIPENAVHCLRRSF